ncbi:MAG: hypothetical protein N2Z58_05880 [Fervidobacterium sp.]|nr:hypothetical protein [Fervidobacterium sp.]
MNEEKDKRFSQILKTVSVSFSYKPGPLMEEKIVKCIRKQKRLVIFYRLSVVVFILLIAVFLGPHQAIVKEFGKVFSLSENFENQLVQNENKTSFNLKTNIPAKTFDLSFSEKNIESDENAAFNEEVDKVFKIIRYVSIANDNGW